MLNYDPCNLEMLNKRFDSLKECQTPDEVRSMIAATGIRAHRLAPHSCAIARYVKVDLEREDFLAVAVSQQNVRIGSAYSPTTVAMAEFVGHFDDGDYPELLAEDY